MSYFRSSCTLVRGENQALGRILTGLSKKRAQNNNILLICCRILFRRDKGIETREGFRYSKAGDGSAVEMMLKIYHWWISVDSFEWIAIV